MCAFIVPARSSTVKRWRSMDVTLVIDGVLMTFFRRPLGMTPEKVYGWSKFQNFILTKFDKINIFLSLTFLLFYNLYKEKMFTIEIEDGCEATWKPSKIIDSC